MPITSFGCCRCNSEGKGSIDVYADHFIWLLLVLVVKVKVALMC